MSDEEESDTRNMLIEPKTKKRKHYGKMRDVQKKLNLQSHELVPDCNCRKRCFERVPEAMRGGIIKTFNLMESINEQNSYLCGLISVLPIQRRRPRNDEFVANFRETSYSYRVRFVVDGVAIEEVICKNAFMSIHGIRRKKMEYLVASLKTTGNAPHDKRGKHNNRPFRLSDECLEAVTNHIKSFKTRASHYGMKDSQKTYLPEELNIMKMYNMFCDSNPTITISYESYRTIFNRDFNISFGYPRTDTCSTCDEFMVKLKALQLEESGAIEQDKERVQAEIRRLATENTVHKVRAEVFYSRKRAARKAARQSLLKEAICLDYGKNLSVPNIPTNDVYFKSQLNVYAFNIHVLSTSQSVFYMYPETVGKKGSDDVFSLLHHFVYNHLSPLVRSLEIFCDSCSGQNKNFTMFRFLHNLVHEERKLDHIKITFPIRGHSYMECDKNMGLVNQRLRAEYPPEWCDIFREARQKPSPFEVVEVDQTFFRTWTDFLCTKYKKKSPFASRPIRELVISIEHPVIIKFRSSFNGMWETATIKDVKKKMPRSTSILNANEFMLPDYSYNELLPISEDKFGHLQHLKKFCSSEAQAYYDALPHN